MAKHKKVVTGHCAYCGTIDRLTFDHVIPQCLYLDGKAPSTAPGVWACKRCNNSKKNLDDSYLRDLLVTEAATSRHPIAKTIFNGPFLRAVTSKEHLQSPLARMIQTHEPRPLDVMSKVGIYLGEVYTLDLPEGRLERIFLTIVRGLYLSYFNLQMPASIQCEVSRIHDFEDAGATAHKLMDQGGEFRKVGDGDVFQCICVGVPERPHVSVWLMVFYQRIVYLVFAREYSLEHHGISPH